jgi:hypothetical protein
VKLYGGNNLVSGEKKKPQPRRNEVALDVDPEVFSNEMVQKLIDDWLTPLLTDTFIEKLLKQPVETATDSE